MNRFYNPTPREYVSTHMDMPWEFLQGVAEQKQKGFDTAMLAGDAAANLLNFNVIPGDQQYKEEKQKQYNDELFKVRDKLMETGDFSSAARNLANITRKITEDQDLAIMKAAVAPYEKDREAYEKMKQEGKLINQWQSNFKLDYSTKDPTTGRHKSYNQLVGYEVPDYNKAARDSFGKLELSTDEQGRTYFLDSQGIKRDVTFGGGSILKQDIINRAETALPAYRNTNAYFDHKVRATWELTNNLNPDLKKLAEEKGENQAIISRADELARQNMISTNLDQVRSQTKNIIRDDLYSEEDKKTRGLIPPPATPVQDIALNIPGSKFDLTKVRDVEYKETADPEKREGVSWKRTENYKLPFDLKQSGKITSDQWHEMGNFFMKNDKDLYNKMFVNRNATQAELQQAYQKYGKFHDVLHENVAAGSTAVTVDASKNAEEKFGVTKPTLGIVSNTSGYGDSTPVYSLKDGEFTTLGELKKKYGPEYDVTFNKNVTPYNIITYTAKNQKIPDSHRFTKSLAFTVEGKGKMKLKEPQQYYLPEVDENIKPNEIAINTMYEAKARPYTKIPITFVSRQGKPYTKYVEFIPSTTDEIELRAQGKQMIGKYVIYNDKGGNEVIHKPVENNIYTADPVNTLESVLDRFE